MQLKLFFFGTLAMHHGINNLRAIFMFLYCIYGLKVSKNVIFWLLFLFHSFFLSFPCFFFLSFFLSFFVSFFFLCFFLSYFSLFLCFFVSLFFHHPLFLFSFYLSLSPSAIGCTGVTGWVEFFPTQSFNTWAPTCH